jgi:hypothetical protein
MTSTQTRSMPTTSTPTTLMPTTPTVSTPMASSPSMTPSVQKAAQVHGKVRKRNISTEQPVAKRQRKKE